MTYKNYNSFPDTAIQAKVDLGILEWNNPSDHSQGWHGKYGIELYNAVTSHDDAALAELIARVENDHAVNLALYDQAIAAGQTFS